MTRAEILRASDRPVGSWRNGGGETSEIARHPPGPDASWWWRVSIATITRDGPFSPFPGCDRILVPLDGPLQLDVAGTIHDVPRLGALRFRGEEEVSAIGVTTPTVDLNVIVDRDRGSAGVQVVTARATRFAPGSRGGLLIVALSAEVATDAGPLGHLDAVRVDPGGAVVIHDGSVAVVAFADSVGTAVRLTS